MLLIPEGVVEYSGRTAVRRRCEKPCRKANSADNKRENAVIELTQEQRNAMNEQAEVRLIDPETNEAFVLVRAEAYDRLKRLLYDDSNFSPEEAFPMLNGVLGKEGWDDPAMDIYNDVTPREAP